MILVVICIRHTELTPFRSSQLWISREGREPGDAAYIYWHKIDLDSVWAGCWWEGELRLAEKEQGGWQICKRQ